MIATWFEGDIDSVLLETWSIRERAARKDSDSAAGGEQMAHTREERPLNDNAFVRDVILFVLVRTFGFNHVTWFLR